MSKLARIAAAAEGLSFIAFTSLDTVASLFLISFQPSTAEKPFQPIPYFFSPVLGSVLTKDGRPSPPSINPKKISFCPSYPP